jgi:hypothetical protein
MVDGHFEECWDDEDEYNSKKNLEYFGAKPFIKMVKNLKNLRNRRQRLASCAIIDDFIQCWKGPCKE